MPIWIVWGRCLVLTAAISDVQVLWRFIKNIPTALLQQNQPVWHHWAHRQPAKGKFGPKPSLHPNIYVENMTKYRPSKDVKIVKTNYIIQLSKNQGCFSIFYKIKNHWLSHWHWPCCVIWSQAHPWAIAEPGRSRCPCWSRGQSLWVFTGSKFPVAGCFEPWPWKTVLPSCLWCLCVLPKTTKTPSTS